LAKISENCDRNINPRKNFDALFPRFSVVGDLEVKASLVDAGFKTGPPLPMPR
jgi:hypothetical protein